MTAPAPAPSPRPRRFRRSPDRRRRPIFEGLESRRLLTTYVVNSTADTGPGTLRRAINGSNIDTAQPNVITFNLGGTGIQQINLLSPLPVIKQAVSIEGTVGTAGNPLVEISGAGAGATTAGLVIQADDTTVEGVTIDHFGGDGIDVSGNNDVIADDHIGTPNIASGGGNGGWGVVITGSNDQVGRGSTGVGNFISGNTLGGVLVAGSGAAGNLVQGNNLGEATGNAGVGIMIDGQASNNLIGSNGDGVNDLLERNVISTNASWGVEISGAGTQHNTVAGNFIGTDATGTVANPNGAGGVLINDGASNNLIGADGAGARADEGNVISGNNGPGAPGVMITDLGTSSNVVAGNFIGTDLTGKVALGNGGVGVFIQAGAKSNRVGTDGDGNGDAREQNVIAANAYQGIYIGGAGTDSNVVAGNLIGVDFTGENALGNGNNGIWIADGATSNRVGVNPSDPNPSAEANEIAANSYAGVNIGDAGTRQNIVAGNFIGTDANGTANLGNGADGVSIANGAQANTIGGTAVTGNLIQFNHSNGVGVYDAASTGNSVRFNSIIGDALGIDLGGDGVTPNHGDTIASGPNNLTNYPIITSAGSGSTTTVGITFTGVPGGTYTIDFYASPVANPSGHGEGNRYLSSATVTTGANGQIASPTLFNLPAQTLTGAWITATATDAAGNTSEFSNSLQLTQVASQVNISPSIASPTYGQSPTFTATVAPAAAGGPAPAGTVQFLVDGQAFGSPVALVAGAATSPAVGALAAGTHTIGASYSGDSTYTTNAGSLAQTITPAPLTITADDQTKVYGAADPGLTDHVSGLVNGDSPAVVSGVLLSTTTGAAATAGTHAITVSGGTAANYTITDVNGTLTVAKAALTVTADDKSKVHGAADPSLTYTASGTLYYGDTYSVITGVSLATATGAAATVGIHPIVASGGTAVNYTITDVNGTLTVTPAPTPTPSPTTPTPTTTTTTTPTTTPSQTPTPPPPATLIGVTAITNKKRRVMQVIVRFSGTVDAAESQGTGAFRLVIAGKKNSFTARSARAIALRSAVYDAASDTVTLTPGKSFPLKRPIQLQVEGQTALLHAAGKTKAR